jgi:hypothetical protein
MVAGSIALETTAEKLLGDPERNAFPRRRAVAASSAGRLMEETRLPAVDRPPPGDVHELPDRRCDFRTARSTASRSRVSRAVVPRRRARGGRAARRSRPPRLAGSGVFLQTRRRARRDRADACRSSASRSASLPPERGLGHVGDGRAPRAGAVVAPTSRGQEQIVQGWRTSGAQRPRHSQRPDRGPRLLSVFGAMRTAGELPDDMQAKVSVMLRPRIPGGPRAAGSARTR